MSAPGSLGAWVWIKLVVWLLLGGKPGPGAPRASRWVLVGLPILGAVAAWAALVKP